MENFDQNEYHRYYSKLPKQKAKRREYAKKYRKTHKVKRDPNSRKHKRLSLRKKSIMFLGKKCKNCNIKCNILEVYDIYHITLIRSPAETMINNLRKWKDIELELLKSILLCKNCGIILKDKQTTFEQLPITPY